MRLVNYIIPVPPKMIESFGDAVVPGNMSLVQLVFFLAVVPGIIEEIAFRGVLLHALRRRFKPTVVVVIVGLFFGIFHVALFRLAPTAFLGMLLAGVTLLSGSILPSMLWHMLNNASAVAALRWRIAFSEMDGYCYLAGPILLCCSFWILWRSRATEGDCRKRTQRTQRESEKNEMG
jgi:membrane protease YdiL (CAAX protease family)